MKFLSINFGAIILAMLFLIQPAGAQISDIIQIPDLIHYWTFDGDGGEIFEDSWGNLELRCTAPGCPLPTAGKVKTALNFDGVDDKLTTDPAQMPGQSNGITVMAWINPDGMDSTNQGIIYKMACFLLEIESQTGFLYWSVRVGINLNEFQPNGHLPLNTWTHVAASYDGMYLRVYKNGDLADSLQAVYPGAIDNPFTSYQVGNSKFDDNRYFQGGIDEVAIFNRALTGAEIQWAYEAGLNGSPLLSIREDRLSDGFQLHPNFPNPFNPSTTLRFEIPALSTGNTQVEMVIYNVQGQKVKTLYKGTLTPGTHQLIWDGHTESGQLVSSGTYYAVLRMENLVKTSKLLLIK